MVPTKPFNTVRATPVLMLLAALAVAAVVAGCGGSSGGSAAPAAAQNGSPQGATVENVSMQVLNGEMATEKGYLAEDGLGHDTFMLTGLSSADASNPRVSLMGVAEPTPKAVRV